MRHDVAAPAWLLVLAGWLAADAALAVRPPPAPPPPVVHAAAHAARAQDASAYLSRASPRELRQLPGLGELRANAYVRERWRRGHAAGPPPLEDVDGIGPTIAEHVARALADRARVR